MSKEEFIALIGQDVVVDYNFCGELQQWSMKNFSIKDGVIRHNRLPLIVDVFIKGAHNPVSYTHIDVYKRKVPFW